MKKEKKYLILNIKNNIMVLFAGVGGAVLLLWSVLSLAWIGMIVGLLLFISGAGIAILQPTHATVSESKITLYYAFGFFSEGAEWKDITAVYENNYKGGKKNDREHVFYFEGMTSKRPREFMRSEIARSKRLYDLITAYWGAPVKRTKRED